MGMLNEGIVLFVVRSIFFLFVLLWFLFIPEICSFHKYEMGVQRTQSYCILFIKSVVYGTPFDVMVSLSP